MVAQTANGTAFDPKWLVRPVGLNLEVYRGKCFLSRIPLYLPVYSVGRGESCDIVLQDPTISHRHLLITVLFDECLVEDLGSKNGTWLDGKRIERARLRAGQVLKIGLFTLRFLTGKTAAPGWMSVPSKVPAIKVVLLDANREQIEVPTGGAHAPFADAPEVLILHQGWRALLYAPAAAEVKLNHLPCQGVAVLRFGDAIERGGQSFRYLPQGVLSS